MTVHLSLQSHGASRTSIRPDRRRGSTWKGSTNRWCGG